MYMPEYYAELDKKEQMNIQPCIVCGEPLTGGFVDCGDHLIKNDEFWYSYGKYQIRMVSSDRWEIQYKDFHNVFYADSPENARIAIMASEGAE